MTRFRKKPVEIEAVQFTGDNGVEIGHFAGITARIAGRDRHLEITTLEGIMTASPGDWIIRGIKGEFYPCKPDIFEATYEPVDETCSLLHPHSGPCTHVEFIAKEVQ